MPTANGIVIFDGSKIVTSGAGTTGQAFLSNGPSSLGSYQSINNIAWQLDTTTGISLVANTGHVAAYTGIGTLNYTLPLTASPGDTFIIIGGSINGWRINQNAGQLIHVGDYATTAGVGGFLASTTTSAYSCVIVTCIVADTEFEAYGIQGTLKLDTINRQNSANAGFTATFNTPVGSAVSLTDGTIADVIAGGVPLNVGLWLILSSVGITGSSLVGTASQGFIGTSVGNSSAGRDLSLNTASLPQVATANSDVILTIPPQVLSVTSTTTYYLKALASFSVGTAAAYGNIRVFKLGNA